MSNYEQLVKALLYCEFGWSARTCDNCEYSKTDCKLLLSDAAAAIEELQAEIRESMQKCAECGANEPKRGEWELIDGTEPMRWGCSRCKYLSWETSSYCPRCGAKMNDSNALNALDNAQDGPIITPCRGCSDYDGYGGCKSNGGCGKAKMEVQDDKRRD